MTSPRLLVFVALAALACASYNPPKVEAGWLSYHDYQDQLKRPFRAMRNAWSSTTQRIKNSFTRRSMNQVLNQTASDQLYEQEQAPWNRQTGYVADEPAQPGGGGLNKFSSGFLGNIEQTVANSVDAMPADNFDAKCLTKRDPSFSHKPSLHFFSSATHSPDTLGCSKQNILTLDYNRVDQCADDDDDCEQKIELRNGQALIRGQLLNRRVYDSTLPTYVIVHGFMASWKSPWMCRMKDLILNNTQANVFIVDWSGGAKPMLPIDYDAAVSATNYVSDLLQQFFTNLIQMTNQQDASNFHLIGHSLGAHICGFTGNGLNSVGQITGLDPAGPCFASGSKGNEAKRSEASTSGLMSHNRLRLSPQSANLVVALHSDGPKFGLNENCGHFDIYVNGGLEQPECSKISLLNPFSLLDLTCSHSYATKLIDTVVETPAILAPDSTTRSDTSRARSRFVRDIGQPDSNLKCYPMAYECDSWEAFQGGECGFCNEMYSDRCVFTGLTIGHPTKRVREDSQQRQERALSDALDTQAIKEDCKHNGEQWKQLGGDKDTAKTIRTLQFSSLNQHFMRTHEDLPICLYHYQVVVASRAMGAPQYPSASDNQQTGRKLFYLQIRPPVPQQSPDEDKNRPVQISHKVDAESQAQILLAMNYGDLVARKSNTRQALPINQYEFYTALVTFSQIQNNNCDQYEQFGQNSDGEWQLCSALSDLQETLLWSNERQNLNSVEWVALNYMSGASLDQRLDNSFVFVPNSPVLSREELSAQDDGENIRMLAHRKNAMPSYGPNGNSGWQAAQSYPMYNQNYFKQQMRTKRGIKSLLGLGKKGPGDEKFKYAIQMTPVV